MPYQNKKVAVVIPVYNSEKTLLNVVERMPDFVDYLIIIDDCSQDTSYDLIRKLQEKTEKSIRHPKNRGYGGCQKTCYAEAMETDAEVVAMIHPDGQHNPQDLARMIQPLVDGEHDVILGSRFSNSHLPTDDGMPHYKYRGNLLLTFIVELFLKHHLVDAHSGYRAYTREFLQAIPFMKNSDNFEFDSQLLIQAKYFNYSVANVPVGVHYPPHYSSISFRGSMQYAFKTILHLCRYKLHTFKLVKSNILIP